MEGKAQEVVRGERPFLRSMSPGVGGWLSLARLRQKALSTLYEKERRSGAILEPVVAAPSPWELFFTPEGSFCEPESFLATGYTSTRRS